MMTCENTLQTVNVLGIFLRVKRFREEINMRGRAPWTVKQEEVDP